MPTATIRARTKPYPERLRAHERVCQRCGIKYTFRPDRENWTECRDCRDVEGNHARPEPRDRAPFNPDACGTPKGYYRHRASGIQACRPCADAVRTYERERKRAKTKNGPRPPKPSACGTPAGWSRHRRANTPPCDPCDEAQRQYERDYYHTKRKIAA